MELCGWLFLFKTLPRYHHERGSARVRSKTQMPLRMSVVLYSVQSYLKVTPVLWWLAVCTFLSIYRLIDLSQILRKCSNGALLLASLFKNDFLATMGSTMLNPESKKPVKPVMSAVLCSGQTCSKYPTRQAIIGFFHQTLYTPIVQFWFKIYDWRIHGALILALCSKYAPLLSHGFGSAIFFKLAWQRRMSAALSFLLQWIKKDTTSSYETPSTSTIFIYRPYSVCKFLKSIQIRRMELWCCIPCSKAASRPSDELEFPLFCSRYLASKMISAVFWAVQNRWKGGAYVTWAGLYSFKSLINLYFSLNTDWILLKFGRKFNDEKFMFAPVCYAQITQSNFSSQMGGLSAPLLCSPLYLSNFYLSMNRE